MNPVLKYVLKVLVVFAVGIICALAFACISVAAIVLTAFAPITAFFVRVEKNGNKLKLRWRKP